MGPGVGAGPQGEDMKPLVFAKARVRGVECVVANGNLTSRIKIVANFTADVATAMEARWVLFDKDQLPKSGYRVIELDFEFKNFRFTFGVEKLGHLELTSELADRFKVLRQGDGKKKPRKLMVQFRIHHAGSPFELIEWLMKIGGAEGKMELSALQQELFQQEKAGEQKRAKRPKVDGKAAAANDAADFGGAQPAIEEDEKPEQAAGPALASKAEVERIDRQFQHQQMDKLRAGAKGGGSVN